MKSTEAMKLLTVVLNDEILTALDSLYPNKLPATPISETEVARLIGQQDVLNTLRRVQQTQRGDDNRLFT